MSLVVAFVERHDDIDDDGDIGISWTIMDFALG
jgi:hypothetical protein